jgi:hypothetical protein
MAAKAVRFMSFDKSSNCTSFFYFIGKPGFGHLVGCGFWGKVSEDNSKTFAPRRHSATKPQPKDKTFAPRRRGDTEKAKITGLFRTAGPLVVSKKTDFDISKLFLQQRAEDTEVVICRRRQAVVQICAGKQESRAW